MPDPNREQTREAILSAIESGDSATARLLFQLTELADGIGDDAAAIVISGLADTSERLLTLVGRLAGIVNEVAERLGVSTDASALDLDLDAMLIQVQEQIHMAREWQTRQRGGDA